MTAPSFLEVSLTAVERNLGVLRRAASTPAGGHEGAPAGPAAPQRRPAVCAVLKADAYGLGAVRVAKRLTIAGADMLAVYTPEQAAELVDAAIGLPILVLMPVESLDRRHALYRAVSRGQIHFTIHTEAGRRALAEVADRQGVTLPVHLEIDSGMRRTGTPLEAAGRLLAQTADHARLRLAGIFTHLASADADPAFTARQADRFAEWLRQASPLIPPTCVVHQANTFGVFRRPALAGGMIRVGLGLFGYAEEEFADPAAFEAGRFAADLLPAVRWASRLVQLTRAAPGDRVGYGGTWTAQRPTRLGVVPAGYADGYPLALSNRSRVGVIGPDAAKAFAPVVGRVSMDQLTIDVTDVPDAWLEAGAARIELIGDDRTAPHHLPTLARQAGTISHELLCRLSPRLERRYLAIDAQPAGAARAAAVGAAG